MTDVEQLIIKSIDEIKTSQSDIHDKMGSMAIDINNIQTRTKNIKNDTELKAMIQDEIKNTNNTIELQLINKILNNKKISALLAAIITGITMYITYHINK